MRMEDDMEVELSDLYMNEIQELLAEQGQEVSLEQAQMIANFVKEVGGLEEALAVLAELRQDRSAA
jgi:hypothetical protein